MATEILATGTAAADSTDVVVTAGTPVTIFLKCAVSGPVPSGADCDIKIKDLAGLYHTIGKLTGREPAKVIDGPGTYRVSRLAVSQVSEAFGADKE